jgi:hypothetical protein
LDEQWQPESLLQPPDRPQDVAMDAQLVDDELAAQPMTLQECVHPLQYAAMGDHLSDDELLSQRTQSRVLAHLQINSQSRGEGTSLE